MKAFTLHALIYHSLCSSSEPRYPIFLSYLRHCQTDSLIKNLKVGVQYQPFAEQSIICKVNEVVSLDTPSVFELVSRLQLFRQLYEELLKLNICAVDKPGQLRFLYDKVSVNIRGHEALGVKFEQYGSLLIPIIIAKLKTFGRSTPCSILYESHDRAR